MHYLLSIYFTINLYMFRAGLLLIIGAWGSVVVKALRYYPEGPEIDSRYVSLEFSVAYLLPTVPWAWGRLSP